MDCLNPNQRHKAMLANKSKDTKIELRLRLALWHSGLRYRKNYKVLGCHVDIVLTKYKIAIFCDGDFWHGKRDISTCTAYWQEKIHRNAERDLENTLALRDAGWTVLRFWGSEIEKQLAECVAQVLAAVEKRKQ